jgi:hypothetical protein
MDDGGAEGGAVPATEDVKNEDTPSRRKGRPGRPALSDEAKALKKAERKAKKKAQGELSSKDKIELH